MNEIAFYYLNAVQALSLNLIHCHMEMESLQFGEVICIILLLGSQTYEVVQITEPKSLAWFLNLSDMADRKSEVYGIDGAQI